MITGGSQPRSSWEKEGAVDAGSQTQTQMPRQDRLRQVPVLSLLKPQVLGEHRQEVHAQAGDVHGMKEAQGMHGISSTDVEIGANMADTVAKAAFVVQRCVSEMMVGHAGKERTMHGRIDKKNSEHMRQAAAGPGRQHTSRDALIQRTKSCPRLRVQSMNRALPV
jgi:hypothetical protein